MTSTLELALADTNTPWLFPETCLDRHKSTLLRFLVGSSTCKTEMREDTSTGKSIYNQLLLRRNVYLTTANKMSAVTKLRAALSEPGKIVVAPGVYDGFTARIVLNTGFDCLYMVKHISLQTTPRPRSELFLGNQPHTDRSRNDNVTSRYARPGGCHS